MHKEKEVNKMPLVKVKRHFQITIPNNMRKSFNIIEGDYMEMEKKAGEIFCVFEP
jgi:AbrB family looped-hinge helix DNA binding protein